MMEMSFIEKFIDDPLSYCPLWNPSGQYNKAMAKIVDEDTDEEEPAAPQILLPESLTKYLNTVTRDLTTKKTE